MKLLYLLLLLPGPAAAQPARPAETAAWQARAAAVTIIRDEWGVPHIYGKTDADVAFGMLYAQCEDNYWQVEESMVKKLGRLAELYGEKELGNDAGMALRQTAEQARQSYRRGPARLRQLCDAAAAGMNYYLHTHPTVPRRLLTRYEPWHLLLFPGFDGTSHGVTAAERRRVGLGGSGSGGEGWEDQQESGSNAMALAPAKSASGHSLLLINPHVGFFGDNQRYEAHLVSEEGLDASGFAMLGQFVIWSGFTATTAWAHTNTAADVDDVYLETFDHPTDSTLYRYGQGFRPATLWTDTLRYRTATGMQQKTFRFRRTHHGPLMARRGAAWLATRPATQDFGLYLWQAWQMSKAPTLARFKAALRHRQLLTNTMYADARGNIAYWHGNAVPRRNPRFDWMNPVDGRDPETEWRGRHPLRELVHVVNPASGWLQNCNSTPYQAAGPASPDPARYPAYMAYDPHSFRAVEAVRQLSAAGPLTPEGLWRVAYSGHLPLYAAWLPRVLAAYQQEADRQPALRAELAAVADTLRAWDYHASARSRATTLAHAWGRQYTSFLNKRFAPSVPYYAPAIVPYLHGPQLPVSDSVAVALLRAGVADLTQRLGTPWVAWGDLNRLQRIHSSGNQEKFADDKPSLPVGAFVGSAGSLFAFSTRPESGQKRQYGVGGNTYVAVVELGPRVKARSVVNFGQSADPASPHYFDQAPLYAGYGHKEAWYYREDVLAHAKRSYHPGE
ncbi:penicillin acylase family protein [Hymenobacter sp. B81]|uniref:penicillin acylase family protein n=1 Tax=Hymenobacter sp. B81 TaxID=3344878 RepID=UPI0037DC994A